MSVSYERLVGEDLNLGFGTVAVTMPAGGSATGHKVSQHTFTREINVLHYSTPAVADATATTGTDNTAAFQAAAAELNAQGGGVLLVPSGQYFLASTLDVTAYTSPIWIRGQGPRATVIYSGVSNTPAIKIASGTTFFMRASGFALYNRNGSLPGAAVAGNYGIRNVTGINYGLILEDLDIRYFANSGIYIEGGTGPTIIRDCSIQSNAGYGIEVVVLAGASPEDVTIERGNIQVGWGGIHFNNVFSCHVIDTDIELGNNGKLPAIYLQGACYGNTFDDYTVSVGASSIIPLGGVVVLDDGPSGCTFIGGINSSAVTNLPNVYLHGSGTNFNTFIGGEYVGAGAGASDYPFKITGVTGTVILTPLLTGTYQAGKNQVNDVEGTDNATTAIGIRTAMNSAANGTTLGGTVVIPKAAVNHLIGGNLFPYGGDNTGQIGDATHRFALVRATTITSGDYLFENGWGLTEAEREGYGEGLLVFDRARRPILVIGPQGLRSLV